jgi:uncharacterized protein (TIGR01777 family)
MRVVLAGGSGFLGTALARRLAADGHEVAILTRKDPHDAAARMPALRVRFVHWDASDRLGDWANAIDGADGLVNVTGASVAGRRWSARYKVTLWDSRIVSTRGLARAVASASEPPGIVVSGSAVGYYGDRGDEVLTEASPAGRGFLARLAVAWEKEAATMTSDRTRVAIVRTGIVLDRGGGALRAMLPMFRLFTGGPLGDGSQWMSWISLADWVGVVSWILTERHDGVFNGTAPTPVTNLELTRALGRTLGRPTWLGVPRSALRLALGEAADEGLLASQRAIPERAVSLGRSFEHPRIDEALQAALASRSE